MTLGIGSTQPIIVSVLPKLVPAEAAVAKSAEVENKQKAGDKGSVSGSSEDALTSPNNPISYSDNGFIGMQSVYTFLQQKWEIIEAIKDSFKTSDAELEDIKEEEKQLEEMREAERKELAKVEEQVRSASKEMAGIMADMAALLSTMNTPTTNPAARKNLISSELQSISMRLSDLSLEVKFSISALEQINVDSSSTQALQDYDQMNSFLTELDKALDFAGQQLQKMIESN